MLTGSIVDIIYIYILVSNNVSYMWNFCLGVKHAMLL